MKPNTGHAIKPHSKIANPFPPKSTTQANASPVPGVKIAWSSDQSQSQHMKRWMDMDSPRRACRGRRRRRGGRCTWSSPSRTAAWIAASCPRRNRRCTPTPSRGPVVTVRAAGAAGERRKSRASTWLRQPGAGSGGAEEPLPRPSLAIYGKEGRGTAWLLSRGFGRYRGPRGVAWSGCLGRWEWDGPAMNDLSK